MKESTRRSRREDFEDLFGTEEPSVVKRKPGRPRKADSELKRPREKKAPAVERREPVADPLKESGFTPKPRERGRRAAAEMLDGTDGFSTSSADLLLAKDGVSSTWLQRAFGMSRAVVEKKIAKCSPVGYGRFGNPLYHIPDAASYLVEPKLDVEEFLATIKPDKLPDRMRESFWNSKLKEQRFLKESGQLWYTDQVTAVIMAMLMSVRDKLQQIPDTVERLAGLDERQWKMVLNMIDGVQEDVYQEILRFSEGDNTLNQLGIETQTTEEDDGE